MVTEPEKVVVRRCRWCGRRFEVEKGPGRPREFCRQACRQRDYEARRGGRQLVTDGDVLVLPRRAVHDLQDRLWLVEAAVDDARTAVDERASAGACRRVLAELVAALDGTVPLWREPPT
jgi:hypothetical protein